MIVWANNLRCSEKTEKAEQEKEVELEKTSETKTEKEEQKIPVQDAPEQQTFPNYWENFNRPSEREVDELLNNKCDDNVDDERDMEEPKKVSTSKLKQMEF